MLTLLLLLVFAFFSFNLLTSSELDFLIVVVFGCVDAILLMLVCSDVDLNITV